MLVPRRMASHPDQRRGSDPLRDVDDYRFVRFLGEGSFGVVVEAVDVATEETVAIKFIQRGTKMDTERVQREILNHRTLNHHHVIRFQRVILTPTDLGIVMEFAERGNLREYLKLRGGVGRKLGRFLFQQIVMAVDYCHKMHVFIRDIKLQNTLVTGNVEWPMLKICDFGYSKHGIADSKPNSKVGTPTTMAPEVLTLRHGEEYDGAKADVWCLGIFLYFLTLNRYPFCTEGERVTEAELYRRIDAVEYTMPAGVPLDCADLIYKILVRNPEDRPSIQEIIDHPYFVKNLPEGARTMNRVLSRRRSKQSVEDIEAILVVAAGTRHSL